MSALSLIGSIFKVAIVKDILWAYFVPWLSVLAYLWYTSGWSNMLAELRGNYMAIPCIMVMNGARFLLGEFLAYIALSHKSIGQYFLYDNGTVFQSTRILGFDLLTCTLIVLATIKPSWILNMVFEAYATKTHALIPGWFKDVSQLSSLHHFFMNCALTLCPFFISGDLDDFITWITYTIINFFIACLVMSKYLGPVIIALANFYWLYSLWKAGELGLGHLSGNGPYFVLSAIWILTLLLNNGGVHHQYPPESYPIDVEMPSFWFATVHDVAIRMLGFMVRDLARSIVLPFGVLSLVYSKYETILLRNSGVAEEVINQQYPKFLTQGLPHLVMLLGFRVFLASVQRVSPFVLRRHFPFLLDVHGHVSIEWRLFGWIDQSVLWYYSFRVTFSSLIFVMSPDLATISEDNVKYYLGRIADLDPDNINAIVRSDDAFARASGRMLLHVTDTNETEFYITTSIVFLGKYFSYSCFYSLAVMSALYATLSLMPKYMGAAISLSLFVFCLVYFRPSPLLEIGKSYILPSLVMALLMPSAHLAIHASKDGKRPETTTDQDNETSTATGDGQLIEQTPESLGAKMEQISGDYPKGPSSDIATHTELSHDSTPNKEASSAMVLSCMLIFWGPILLL